MGSYFGDMHLDDTLNYPEGGFLLYGGRSSDEVDIWYYGI